MSVQSQIDRIDGNVKKALAKISEKGVSVAANANSDDLETLISAIETGGNLKAVVRTVTLASDVTGAKDQILLSGDEFIKKHYANDWFYAILFANSLSGASGVIPFNIQGNRMMAANNTGIGFRYTSASVAGTAVLTTNIKAEGWGQHMRVGSSGKLSQYLHTGYILKAGTYTIVLISVE